MAFDDSIKAPKMGGPARAIDYDRGVIINVHKQTGMDVFMYLDTPGVYLNAHGGEVSEKLASEAGYDTVRWGKQRLIRERTADAHARIKEELEEAASQRRVVAERNGFQILDLGLGRHQVLHDGEVLTKEVLPLDLAEELLEQLAPSQVEAA